MRELTASRDCHVAQGLMDAARAVVAMTYAEARAADANANPLLYCNVDVLNPCYEGRPTDVHGKHWGGGDACPACRLRSALAQAQAAKEVELGPTR